MPYLSLYRLPVTGGTRVPGDGIALVLAHDGAITAEGQALAPAAALRAGTALAADGTATALAFVLSQGPAAPAALRSEEIDVAFPCLFRLDEVAFPPGAIAYRHVHPGPGFRHLRWGALRLDADAHSFDAAPGHTWFEPANTPVRATAGAAPETRFVRAMVLPPAYEGKPTIQILDPGEAALPKRQVTHRHIDLKLAAWP